MEAGGKQQRGGAEVYRKISPSKDIYLTAGRGLGCCFQLGDIRRILSYEELCDATVFTDSLM